MPKKSDTIISIPLAELKENPLNQRSMESPQIKALAADIELYGQLDPLIVYQNEKKEYVLIAGHRRKAALEMNGAKNADCLLVDEPEDPETEQELITSLNFSRRKPEELQDEVMSCVRNYNHMPKELRAYRNKKLRDHFIKEHESDPAYIQDPEGFINATFRPKYEYVRVHTGMDISNSTIKGYLRQHTMEEEAKKAAENAEAEIAEPEQKEPSTSKKDREITIESIAKEAGALLGMMKAYRCEDDVVRDILEKCMSDIDDLLMFIKED